MGSFVPSGLLRPSFRPQCLDRIDTRGAACGQVAGHRRGPEHERSRGADGHGIGGLQTVEEARHEAASEREADARGARTSTNRLR
jgi:hypothetical protein